MSPDVVAAFFAGMTAVLSSGVALWLERRRSKEDCEKRLRAYIDGLHEGERKVE